jgi:hypothetical protein
MGMNRAYGEPVDVDARADGRPVMFAWRSQKYTVRAILEHWVVAREWWQGPQADPREPDLEFWRIQADPEANDQADPEANDQADPEAEPRVYELLREAATGAWTLRG